MIVIPAIDLAAGKCVRLRQGDMDQQTIYSDTPAEMARRLIARLDNDQEIRVPLRLDRIMAGDEPEIEIRADDVIAVGSHVAAPFLAVIRNAFRMTYGFGFIYDRNFAETNFGQSQSLSAGARDFFGD